MRYRNLYVMKLIKANSLKPSKIFLAFKQNLRIIYKNPSLIKNHRERERVREARIHDYEPSFWSFSLNSFSKALSIISAKLPSLGLESETFEEVRLVWRSRSDSSSESERGTKSEQRRSRVGAKINKKLHEDLLSNIAEKRGSEQENAAPAHKPR